MSRCFKTTCSDHSVCTITLWPEASNRTHGDFTGLLERGKTISIKNFRYYSHVLKKNYLRKNKKNISTKNKNKCSDLSSIFFQFCSLFFSYSFIFLGKKVMQVVQMHCTKKMLRVNTKYSCKGGMNVHSVTKKQFNVE